MVQIAMKDALATLDSLQRDTFGYFWHEANPTNGLIADNTSEKAPASIAAVGFALAAYAIGVERAFLTRAEAVERILKTLRFFWHSPQQQTPDSTGWKGFYYHFLDMQTGQRTRKSELSTIDTAYLLAGMLLVAQYFDQNSPDESELRSLAEALSRRVDWRWALNDRLTVANGWTPEEGFLKDRWKGYNEALLLYVLGLGSPTFPLPTASYAAWVQTYHWEKLYGYEFLYSGPLFTHQLSHLWIDFRGIQDDFMQHKGIDYFENSRRATYIQRQYAIQNPQGFKGYNENCWGLTASDGPGPCTYLVDGIQRHFYGYSARGVPYGPDDGTVAPGSVVSSLPFAPEIVLPALNHFYQTYPQIIGKYGFKGGFNPTFPASDRNTWISGGYFGLDQGPIILMIENYRSGLLWRLMEKCPHIVSGLRRAGFTNGWLA